VFYSRLPGGSERDCVGQVRIAVCWLEGEVRWFTVFTALCLVTPMECPTMPLYAAREWPVAFGICHGIVKPLHISAIGCLSLLS
jgi:hypothetical protein